MSLVKEAIFSSGATVLGAIRLKAEGDHMPTSRSALALNVGLTLAFREGQESYLDLEVLRKLFFLVPAIYALNDYHDMGMSARLRLDRVHSQNQFYPLLWLERSTREHAQSEIDRFQQIYPSDRETEITFQNALHDGTLLSANRKSFEEEDWPRYKEIENGIYETLTYGVVRPDILHRVNFPLEQTCQTLGDLENKYSLFTSDLTKPALTQEEKMIKGLHAIEMVLTTHDDPAGIPEDSIMGIPNLAILARHRSKVNGTSPQRELQQIRDHYKNQAVSYGFPPVVVSLAGIGTLFHTLRVNKARGISSPLEISELNEVLKNIGRDPVLRERLRERALLAELFK